MKPAILCLLMFSWWALPLKAQAQEQTLPEQQQKERRHEVSVGYGVLGAPVLASGMGRFITILILRRDIESRITGPAILGYHYRLSQKVSLGFTASYTHLKTTYKDTGEEVSQINYYAVLPRFSYYWARNPKVEVYSGIGLGACYQDSSFDYGESNRQEVLFMAQVTVLGVRAGRKTGFFLETGVGMNGLLNAGIDRRF